MRCLVALLLALTSACCSAPDKLVLDERWRPLERLERSDEQEAGVFWTLSPVVHTRDICDFLKRSIVDQNGLLVHERLHALHQLATERGPLQYLYLYRTDATFRLIEEQVCTSAQIAYVTQHGGTVDAAYLADFMSAQYRANDGGILWTRDQARKWVDGEVTKAKVP